ncbi:hypothetical protein KCU67_g6084, partial [Aureobasidium melanogenum]
MTPDYLQGTYTTYKKDTDAIANWLATTAKRCGFSPEVLKDNEKTPDHSPPPPQPQPEAESTKLKGRARKLARDAVSQEGTKSTPLRTYTIPIKSFTQLASQNVSSSTPAIKVPAVLGTILDRAIAFRKEHNASFKNIKLATETSSDIDSHAHFISVLERVRHILRPYMAEKAGAALSKQSQAHSRRATENKARNQNAFEALEVEELSDKFLNASLSENVSKHNSRTAERIRYQAESMNKADEHIIAGFILINSINKIRKHIKGLWEAYINKDIDLHATAISTNTAIEIVRHVQEDHDKSFHDQPDFQACVVPCFITTCRLLNVDVLKREQPTELYNFDAYDIANGFFVTTWFMLDQLRGWRVTDKIAYVDHLVPKCRDTSTEWSHKSIRDKILDDKFMLFRAFTGLTAMATMDRWVEDEFVRGVRDMSPDKPVPLWLAFAAQVYLDVQHTLGAELGRAYQEMQKGGKYMKSTLDQTVAFHEKLSSNPLNPTFCKQIRDHMRTTGELIEFMLISDLVDWRINGNNIKRLPSFDFFQHYPVMCGLYLFGGRYTMQRSSISCVKDWTVVIYCAHLYNALKVQHLTGRWEDMEVLFKLQGGDRIFMGAAPQSIADCVKRFNLCRGLSITNSASDRADNGGKKLKINPNNRRNVEDHIPFASLIAGRYMCYDNVSLATDLTAVEAKIKALCAEQLRDSSTSSVDVETKTASNSASKVSKTSSKHALTATDFLDGMAAAVHSEGMNLTFDYLRLHRTCCTILTTLEAEVSYKFDGRHPYAAPNGIHRLHMPDLVGCILMQAEQMETHCQHVYRDDAQYTGETLRGVAETFNKIVGGKAGSIGVEIIKKTFGYE